MEKENKIVFITKSCLNKKKEYDYCYNRQMDIKEAIEKIKKATNILIYDITFNAKEEKGKSFSINDHINKTGKNLLIKKNSNPVFIDISKLYRKNKKGVITTGLGEYYNKFYKKTKYPSTDLCLISVWCKSINANLSIEGKLINTF
tara:strand:+ start:128 stop:565 length:438 start_codon:yes stop_codon:yes gene_type:complete